MLSPGVIDDYRLYGYCLVVTADVVEDRALQTGDRDARAYYDRLDHESPLVKTFSPYDKGADPVPFSFDFPYDYYPPEYPLAGPHHPDPPAERLPGRPPAPPIIRIRVPREPAPFSASGGRRRAPAASSA